MEKENNQCFNINESDELTKQKNTQFSINKGIKKISQKRKTSR